MLIAKRSALGVYPQSAGQGMRPISTTHQAVGMALAWDPQGDAFLSRMDLVLEQLNCELLPGAAAVVAPELGANILKVPTIELP